MMITYWMCYCILFLSVHTSRTANSFNDEDRLCPKKCSCNINENITVKCRRLNLSRVPNSTVVMSANEMDLSSNNIRNVTSTFFEGCNNLSTLIMNYSRTVNIDASAFHSLTNLETIDLSGNVLTYIPPDLFIQNPKLKYLSLSSNPLICLRNNGSILTSSSLLHLHMKKSMISELSNISLSRLPNLQSLDLSQNRLKVLSADTLSPLLNLIDINLSENPLTCNNDFKNLVCLSYNKSNAKSRTMICSMNKNLKKSYNLQDQHELCKNLSVTSSSVTSITSTHVFHDILLGYTTGGLQEDTRKRTNENDEAFTISISKQPSTPYNNKGPENSEEGAGVTQTTVFGKRVLESEVTGEVELSSAAKSEKGGWASLLSWNVNTMMVFVILPVTLSAAVFVSLVAVICVKKRFCRPQHETQGKDDSFAAFLPHVPLLGRQLTAYQKRQSSESVSHNEYHVYEEIY